MDAGKADRHILIVEDDSDLVIVLVQVLEQEGYRVSAASRRVEALAVLGQGDVDLIVADSVLRGGNGDDIAKAAGEREVPVIMISGEPERIARLRGGATPFLAKPFRATALIRLVDQLLA
jgi:two-component system OmpR family response regulator